MNNSKKVLFRILLPSISLLFILFGSVSCTFEQIDHTPLTFTRIDSQGDTTSPWPTFVLLFTPELADTAVQYEFSPNPGSVFYSILSQSADTLTISVTGQLEGSTQYRCYPSKILTSINNKYLDPDSGSFIFTTYPCEKEPNNTPAEFDTLDTRLFGEITTLTDTDGVLLDVKTSKKVYLINHVGKSALEVYDSASVLLETNKALTDTLNYIFPVPYTGTLYFKVYSLIDSKARYELVRMNK